MPRKFYISVTKENSCRNDHVKRNTNWDLHRIAHEICTQENICKVTRD